MVIPKIYKDRLLDAGPTNNVKNYDYFELLNCAMISLYFNSCVPI